jgi:hypothetical protein
MAVSNYTPDVVIVRTVAGDIAINVDSSNENGMIDRFDGGGEGAIRGVRAAVAAGSHLIDTHGNLVLIVGAPVAFTFKAGEPRVF